MALVASNAETMPERLANSLQAEPHAVGVPLRAHGATARQPSRAGWLASRSEPEEGRTPKGCEGWRGRRDSNPRPPA